MDIPTWTITLAKDEKIDQPRMVLRALLAVIPGREKGPLRESLEATCKAIQGGARRIEGDCVEIADLVDSVEVYYANEVLTEGTQLARDQASVAAKWANDTAAILSTKATGKRSGIDPKPEPVKAAKGKSKVAAGQTSLFGDE